MTEVAATRVEVEELATAVIYALDQMADWEWDLLTDDTQEALAAATQLAHRAKERTEIMEEYSPAEGGYSILSTDKTRMEELHEALKVAEMAFTDICQFTPSGPTDNFEQIAKHARATTLEAIPLIRVALQNVSTIP